MSITGAMVKELRERTGAGILDCKKALTETNGDIEAAIDWLRENGLAKAAKKNDRIAAEGLCGIKHKDNVAVIYEVNSETDFVAKNDKFLDLMNLIGDALLVKQPADVEAALKIDLDGQTLEEIINQAIAIIGEKISLRRFEILKKDAQGAFGVYLHMGGTIAALAVVEGINDEAIAKNVAMHIAASNPLALSRADLPQDVVERERKVITEVVLGEGKPANIAEKMIEGRMGKYYAESVLLEQTFVIDPDLKVSKYLENNSAVIARYVRYAVGEGIEKAEVDFAAEVMSQVK